MTRRATSAWGRRRDDLVDPNLLGAFNRRLVSLLIVERVLLTLASIVLPLLSAGGHPELSAWQHAGFVLLCAVLLSLAVRLRLRDNATPGENLFVVHLLADTTLLTYMLHQTGGTNNPFIVFYLLPMSLAAYALSWPRLLGCAAATLAMLLLLGRTDSPSLAAGTTTHETGELIAFGLLACFVYAVARLSRKHERRVARAREDALNELSARALGSVAARAADAISSPLSTMSVLVHELRQERLAPHECEAALATLAGQIELCKSRLSELLESVGQTRGQHGEARDIRALVESAVHECELIDTTLEVDIDQPTREAPRVVAERSLRDALVLLIRHCGEADPHRVHIDIRWDRQWVSVGLRGQEPPRRRAPATDAPDTTTPDDGPIALAATLLNRFNGSLSRRAEGHQCILQVMLPAMPARNAGEQPSMS
ncbi:hypothetical protein [uncultured Piscinibacter sp.]|uniref:hypothetical protein n=1 Tax=uncultured Piscinibacter sp. TaxID=1131835 RepID=UPI0026186539|nr:hypothetical protein [uncultured Piscinibacter sp.]